MTTKPALQKILQGILCIENKSKQNYKRIGNNKTWEKKDKESENNINSGVHNQTLKQQKQLNDKNHNIPISTNIEC
jgi:hypothetical protein